MKRPNSLMCRCQGAVMLFALLVVVVGAIVLVGWAQIMATRGGFSASSETGFEQRIAVANARSLARQYVLQQMASGDLTASNVSLPWGGFTMGAISGFWSQSNTTNNSVFSPLERGGFNSTNLVEIRGVATAPDGTFVTNISTNRLNIRTRSPIAAGFPLVLQTNAVNNGVVLPATRISYLSGTNGTQFVWPYSGFPLTPVSSGTGFAGVFSAPVPIGYDSTLLTSFQGYTNARTNNLQIFIDPPDSPNSFFVYTVPNEFNSNPGGLLPDNSVVRIYPTNAPITELRIIGSTRTSALHIIIPPTSVNLTNIILEGDNTRPISVNRTGTNALRLTRNGTQSRTFDIAISLNGTPLTIAPLSGSTTLTLRGGIRTSSSVTATSSLILVPRTPSVTLDYITDRMMWLEDTRIP